MRRSLPQLEIAFAARRGTWGGQRAGAGRKRLAGSGVRHGPRPLLGPKHPVHVSLKVRREIGSLRTRRCHAAIRAALVAGCERQGFRVCHYSVLATHLHLIVEAKDRASLSRGMQGLAIRMARQLNKALGRTGRVFADRYFARALKTPREVRNAIAYVYNNEQRHRFGKGAGWRELTFDPFSSASAFDGWRVQAATRQIERGPPAVARAQSWLLRVGWRRLGLLVPAYVPQWGNRW